MKEQRRRGLSEAQPAQAVERVVAVMVSVAAVQVMAVMMAVMMMVPVVMVAARAEIQESVSGELDTVGKDIEHSV